MSILASLIIGGVIAKSISKSNDNKFTEDIINSNIREARYLINRIDRNIDFSQNECNTSLEKLHKSNKSVCETTFPAFVRVAEKMMNVEFDDDIGKAQKIRISDDVKCTSSINFTGSMLTSVGTGLAFTGLIGGGINLATQLIYSVKLEGVVAESRLELAKVKSVVEIAKREIAKMRSISNLAETAATTVKALQKIADEAVKNFEHITKVSGFDFDTYSEDDKNSTWLTFKLISALNELVNMKILTDSGAISAKFRKFVGDINTELLEENAEAAK